MYFFDKPTLLEKKMSVETMPNLDCFNCVHKVRHFDFLSSDNLLNPYATNGFSHQYYLGKSTFILGEIGVIIIIIFFISLFDEISRCKQNSPRWDAAFCGYVPQKADARLIYVICCILMGFVAFWSSE